MLALLAKYPTPKALRDAGMHRVEALLRKQAPRAWKRWAAAIFTALDGQTVVVSGTAAGLVLPQLAASLAQTRSSRDEVLVRTEELVGGASAFRTPDVDAGSRCQDRGEDPDRGGG